MSLDQLQKSMHSGNNCCTLLEGVKGLILKCGDRNWIHIQKSKVWSSFFFDSYKWAFETMQLSLFLVSAGRSACCTWISWFDLCSVAYWLPWWLSGKESACQCRRCRFDLWDGEDPLGEKMATHSSILAWKNFMDRGAWWAIVHGVAESQTWLSD